MQGQDQAAQGPFSWRFTVVSIVIVALGLVYLFFRSSPAAQRPLYPPEEVATGLDNPRALAFASDGSLYVAESGTGAADSGRITRITPGGQQAVVARGLRAGAGRGRLRPAGPVALWPLPDGMLIANEAGGGQLLLLRGQQAPMPALNPAAALARVGLTGTVALLGLVASSGGDQVVILEAVSASLIQVDLRDPQAAPRVVGRLPAGARPVAIAPGAESDWLVVDIGSSSLERGSGKLWRVQPSGEAEVVLDKLTMPIAAAVGLQGEVYVLEFSAFYNRSTDRFTPNSGRLLVARSEQARQIIGRLQFPTALVHSADSNLYYTTNGAHSEAGTGRVGRLPSRSPQPTP